MVQLSKVGMLAHFQMEIHNMIPFLRLIMWICDIEFLHMSNMEASSSWSNDPNQKHMQHKNTLICVAICGNMKKNVENPGHGFCAERP